MDTTALAPRALVVEDDVETADLVSRYAGLLGCRVRIANSGHDALQLAAEFLPQIILLDIKLPDVEGWELAHALHQRLDAVAPVIIAISGEPKNEARLAESGIDHYLEKPAFRKDLMELLMKLVGRREA